MRAPVRLRGNKYGAVRTEYRGALYDSKAEAAYAADLDMRKRAGLIERWERGEKQTLVGGGPSGRKVTYRPDFIVYAKDGTAHAVDVKGYVTREFRIKAILWELRFPHMPLLTVKNGREVDVLAPYRRRGAA